MRFTKWITLWITLWGLGVYPVYAVEDDTPPQPKETYANYYIEGKKENLQPFWEALDTMPEYEKTFLLAYRDARHEKDAALLETLFHPASLACDNEMRAPYYESMREFYLNEEFPESFDFRFIPVAKERQWPLKERLEFPVAPTHILYIEYRDGIYTEGLQRFLRLETEGESSRFYEVMKCPSRVSMEKMMREAEATLDSDGPAHQESP